MPMTPAAIAAENAQRTLSRISGAAIKLGVRYHVLVDLTAHRGDRLVDTRSQITITAALVAVQRNLDQQGDSTERLLFSIRPTFPCFIIDADGPAVDGRHV